MVTAITDNLVARAVDRVIEHARTLVDRPPPTERGAYLREARRLVLYSQGVMLHVIRYEVAHGTPWEDIADQLGMGVEQARQTYQD